MERGGAGDAILVRTGLVFVTLTSAVSAYRAAAAEDVVSAVFVAVSYSTLLLLFRSLRAYERLLPGDDADGRRRHLKREVWALCTLLTVLFAWKAAAAMPSWPVAAAVWAMAALNAVGGFVAMFRRHP
ncbi:hypothetical protein BS78_10G036800 [Paspalum vaginatum]|nr:hypothetical protein BS78_10G036800 [Paspalum vaginatum]KAJ1257961.1 hypothetical protein BS78_10G036800 [Paspalum vaginatum]KAJ1257962.1 hypothetical protein BS78_10G036800 [Paspalum vaginatum]KAJ1257963.1 hypothetical protein BS78_10G036800 [Paspalum vaginatum]